MKPTELRQLIKEELNEYFKTHQYSLRDEMIMENDITLGELLNPDYSYPYKEVSKGYYTYIDNSGDIFFVKIHWVNSELLDTNYMEFKTGWLDKNGKANYEPVVPPHSKNSSAIYVDKRSDTVAKIYRDEVLPFFEQQTLTDIMLIKPISSSRAKFAERLVKKFTPTDKFNIEYGPTLIITKKNG